MGVRLRARRHVRCQDMTGAESACVRVSAGWQERKQKKKKKTRMAMHGSRPRNEGSARQKDISFWRFIWRCSQNFCRRTIGLGVPLLRTPPGRATRLVAHGATGAPSLWLGKQLSRLSARREQPSSPAGPARRSNHVAGLAFPPSSSGAAAARHLQRAKTREQPQQPRMAEISASSRQPDGSPRMVSLVVGVRRCRDSPVRRQAVATFSPRRTSKNFRDWRCAAHHGNRPHPAGSRCPLGASLGSGLLHGASPLSTTGHWRPLIPFRELTR